jgi:hypothetical protein
MVLVDLPHKRIRSSSRHFSVPLQRAYGMNTFAVHYCQVHEMTDDSVIAAADMSIGEVEAGATNCTDDVVPIEASMNPRKRFVRNLSATWPSPSPR